MSKVRRMPIADAEAALRAYYGNGYIGNREIGDIFGTKTPSTIHHLKLPVRRAEAEKGLPVVVPYHVNTRIAFAVWGIDVAELERNRKKRLELGL